MKKVSITHMDNHHNQWLRALEFYKQEFHILKNRLTEIGKKNTGDEVMKQVEHYENQFKVQSNNIDKLGHDIRENVSQASQQVQQGNAGYIDSHLFQQHAKLENEFIHEEKIINELRHDFNRFSAEWM